MTSEVVAEVRGTSDDRRDPADSRPDDAPRISHISDPRLRRWLCLLNVTVLITHQIDAAYWHEWEMFRIPGGNQVNLLLNLPIVVFVLHAYARVDRGGTDADAWTIVVASLGALTVMLHAAFFAAGHHESVQPVSIALLVATAVLSTAQAVLGSRTRAGKGPDVAV
jgi:hypothetical protein